MSQSFHDHLVDTYLNGGSMRWYWKSLFHYANQMISRARIARNHKHAAELQSVFDRLFTGKKLEPLEAFAIHKAVHDHYEFLVDDILLISAFELYAKAVLLTKGYLPHVIEKPSCLHQRQRKVPVHVRTVRASVRSGVDFNVTTKTIGCQALLSKKYQAIIGVPKKHATQLRVMNQRRNLIHYREPATTYSLTTDYLAAVRYLSDAIEKRAA